MDIRPLTPTEQKYTYTQSMQLEGQTGTIGHLRGDFATTGYGFYTTWFDTRPQWKSDEFKADLDTVINALREDKGLLHNRYDIATYDTEQYFALNTLVVVTAKQTDINLKYILALLNSTLFNYIYAKKFKSTKKVFSEIQARSVGELPVKRNAIIEAQIITLVNEAIERKRQTFAQIYAI